MTTAIVLSGGGSLGAVQVGMLQALEQRGVRPDVIIGTSAGAMNAGFLAGRGMSEASLDQLAAIWRGLRRSTVFPLDPLRRVLSRNVARSALCSNAGLRHLVESNTNYRALEDARVPVYIVATDLLSGREVLMSSGDAVSAILASTAIPGILPPIEREGLTLIDGAVADNTALSQAVALGADEVYLLPAGFACALDHRPRGALGVAVQALTLLIEQRLVIEVAQFEGHGAIKVLPPLCPLNVSAIDFGHADELIERGRTATLKWLDSGNTELPSQQRFLSLHTHQAHSHPERPPDGSPSA
jgi:NTE family protein